MKTIFLFVGISLVVFLFIIILLGKATEIQKCNSIRQLVNAISYGRIHPYHIGMKLKHVKYAVRRLYTNTEHFEQTLQLYEIIGHVPGIELPPCANKYIGRIYIGFKLGIISTITVYIKTFSVDAEELIAEMSRTFGAPTSVSNEFIIWEKHGSVININLKRGSISVFDERLGF